MSICADWDWPAGRTLHLRLDPIDSLTVQARDPAARKDVCFPPASPFKNSRGHQPVSRFGCIVLTNTIYCCGWASQSNQGQKAGLVSSDGAVYILDTQRAAAEEKARFFSSANLMPHVISSPREVLRGEFERPACFICAFYMPELHDLELLSRLRMSPNPLPVIMVSAKGDVKTAVQAVKLGASEFLEAPIDSEQLLGLVQHWIDFDRAALGNMRKCAAIREKLSKLSRREHEVLDGILDGLSNKEMARKLNVSPKSIEVYRGNLMSKMDVYCVQHLVKKVLCCPALSCAPYSCLYSVIGSSCQHCKNINTNSYKQYNSTYNS